MSCRKGEHIHTLLVEDGMLIGDSLKTDLSKMDLSIDWFTEGRRGREVLYGAPYDAVILDLMLPGINGRGALREWRASGEQESVLVLTTRDALAKYAEDLCLGTDDYLCKSLMLIGAAARLEALVRCTSDRANNTLYHGQVTLDPGALVATVAGEPLSLKPRGLALLELLMHNKGCVPPRKLIEGKLYTWDENVSNNAVEVHVHHLRRKLGSDFIHIVHSIGCTLDDA